MNQKRSSLIECLANMKSPHRLYEPGEADREYRQIRLMADIRKEIDDYKGSPGARRFLKMALVCMENHQSELHVPDAPHVREAASLPIVPVEADRDEENS